VKDYRHKGERRKNIPDAGLASYNNKPQPRIRYAYDSHLDPHLIWAGKAERTSFEIETVSLHIHERISTRAILKSVQFAKEWQQERLFAEPELPLDKRVEFYQHDMEWVNRLILGDSLLVMNSLIERELMAGKVQAIYIDPPYGIAYKSNFQPFINRRDVRDGQDDSLTREPEQIQAFRDTWNLGVHSYLTYLRDRLHLCCDLLHPTGSIFVQIGDANVHHVRELMDEVFGPQNFCAVISFLKTSGQSSPTARTNILPLTADYLLWYAKDISQVKYHQLYLEKSVGGLGSGAYQYVEAPDGARRRMTSAELRNPATIPDGYRIFRLSGTSSQTKGKGEPTPFAFQGREFRPEGSRGWSTTIEGLQRLAQANRLMATGKTLSYVRYFDDFPVFPLTNVWTDTGVAGFGEPRLFVVQTNPKVVERCILMTTEPGDLVFDPTCGGGTTAYCAEKWGRRWITCDTSRVALALARQRLMTAKFDYWKPANPDRGVDAGFVYETVSHIRLQSIAQNQPPRMETLYDRPAIEREIVRVSGPITVEAIPVPVMDEQPRTHPVPAQAPSEVADHVDMMIGLLRKSGALFPGGRRMILEDLRPISSTGFLHAEGEATQNGSKVRVAVSFGPKYGPVTARQVDEAIRSSYRLGFDVLVLAGLVFDPEAQATIQKNPFPKLQVHLANISPDVVVGEYSEQPLLKTTKASQLFTVFGQPDIGVEKSAEGFVVKLHGVDVYNPETGEVYPSSANEIPAWFLDEDYDGYTFRIRQAFFPKEATAKNPWDRLENALRGVVDMDKIEKFRGTESLPFKGAKEKRIAVKVIDKRGNEVMVVKSLSEKEQT
jgi:adenine-specific DNA-methyltransferase